MKLRNSANASVRVRKCSHLSFPKNVELSAGVFLGGVHGPREGAMSQETDYAHAVGGDYWAWCVVLSAEEAVWSQGK